MALFLSEKTAVDAVVVGLGNPGEKYDRTRHNVGFRAIDYISGACNCDVRRLRNMALTGKCTLYGRKILLVKPQTYMNSSGQAVSEILKYYRLDPSRLIVICDDVTLLAGSVRIRKKGSAGGHNGLKSIIECLGTDDFARIRVGVGSKYGTGELIDFVLESMSAEDTKAVNSVFPVVYQAIEPVLDGDFEKAMSKYNITKRKEEDGANGEN